MRSFICVKIFVLNENKIQSSGKSRTR